MIKIIRLYQKKIKNSICLINIKSIIHWIMVVNNINSEWIVFSLYTKQQENQNKQIFIEKNTKKIVYIMDYFQDHLYQSNIKKIVIYLLVLKLLNLIDNGSVVYPFALTNNYAYLILENVYLKRDFDDKDPYDVFYDF